MLWLCSPLTTLPPAAAAALSHLQLLNPGSLKQALVEGAVRLPDLNMYEQGNGRINLPASAQVLAAYSPRASIIPPAIDFTDCPYMWPYCTQPLYAFGLPVAFNATIVNGMAVTAQLKAPPVFRATDEGGRLLHVTFQYSDIIWPWSGYLAVFVEVRGDSTCVPWVPVACVALVGRLAAATSLSSSASMTPLLAILSLDTHPRDAHTAPLPACAVLCPLPPPRHTPP